MIEVSRLTKSYGKKLAVDDITFTVNEGEILGLLGPNGAGKSTTMNVITGYLSATKGSVKVGGFDILENPNEVKKQIGYLPEIPPLYTDMTVKEYLEFVYELKKCKLKKKEHLSEIADIVKITDVYGRLINNLSKGYRQRVGLAQALIGNPPVLILDEPTIGLDPKEIIEIRNLIKHLGKKRTVILSSHILPEIQAVCERILVINNGKIVADGSPDDLSKSSSASFKLAVRIAGPLNELLKLINGIKGVKYANKTSQIEKGAYDFVIESTDNIDIRKPLFNELATKGWPILSLKPLDMTLEDAFIRIIDSESREADSIEETEAENIKPIRKRSKAKAQTKDTDGGES